MPWPAKKRRVRLTYLVATVSRRPWRGAEIGGDVVEVGHVAHVDPRLAARRPRRRSGRSRAAGPARPSPPVGHRLLDLVAAGDAEMDGAGAELARDLRRREVRDLDAGEPVDAAAIARGRRRPGRGRARRGRRRPRRSPAAGPWRGWRGRAARSWSSTVAPTRSSQIEKPTAGTSPRPRAGGDQRRAGGRSGRRR